MGLNPAAEPLGTAEMTQRQNRWERWRRTKTITITKTKTKTITKTITMGKKVDHERRRGVSYLKRVAAINRVYDRWSRTGLSNREIWRRYIYPVWGISERTLYYMLKAGVDSVEIEQKSHVPVQGFLFPEMLNEDEKGDI